jgi:hypothetical protein
MDVREIGSKDVNWTELARITVQCQVLVTTVMKLSAP